MIVRRDQFDLEIPGPFCARELFEFFARRSIAGVEVAEPDVGGGLRYARTLRLPDGPAAFEVVARPEPWRLHVTTEAVSRSDAALIPGVVGTLFDVDADSAVIDDALAAEPRLAAQVEALPGIRVPGACDLGELVVRAIVGQQISVAGARTHLNRLAAGAGTPYVSSIPGLSTLFPTPADIASAVPVPGPGEALDPDRLLRLPRRSIGTVVGASAALADGGVSAGDLARLPGIGPWTAGYIQMRIGGDPDAWLPGDVALIGGARNLGLLDADLSTRQAHPVLTAISERWRPWRAYAAMRLWHASANPAGES